VVGKWVNCCGAIASGDGKSFLQNGITCYDFFNKFGSGELGLKSSFCSKIRGGWRLECWGLGTL